MNAVVTLGLFLVVQCGSAVVRRAPEIENYVSAAPSVARSGLNLWRFQRRCANDSGVTNKRAEITTTDQQAINLGRTDLAGALAFIKSNYPPDLQRRAKFTLMFHLCQDRLDLLPDVVSVLGDPEAAGSNAPLDVFSSRAAFESICAYWVTKDPDKIFAKVQSLPPSSLSAQLRSILAPLLAPVDFPKTVALVEPLSVSQESPSLVKEIAKGFKGDDFAALLNWTQKLPRSYATSALVSLALRLAYEHDLVRLEKLSLSEPLPPGGHVLVIFGRALGKDSPDNVVTRVDSLLTTPEKKEAVLIGALQSMPLAKNREVANRLLGSIHLETRAAVYSRTIPRLFSLNPDDAIQSALNSPDDLRSTALQTLTEEWYRADPAGLADWISRLPQGRNRSLAETFQTNLILRADREKAIQDAAKMKQSPPAPPN